MYPARGRGLRFRIATFYDCNDFPIILFQELAKTLHLSPPDNAVKDFVCSCICCCFVYVQDER